MITFEDTLQKIDWIMGYFQFKSEDSETAQKGIRLLQEVRDFIKITYARLVEKS